MGFFQNLLGGGGPNVSGLQKSQKALIQKTTSLGDTGLDYFNQADRQGAWDPNVQLDQLARDNAYATKLQSNNAAAAARTLGYRPGDSEPLVTQRAISEGARNQYDQMANRIRSNALQGRLGAYGNAAGLAASLYGQGVSAYQNQIQQGLAQQAQSNGLFGTLLGSTMPFVNGWFKKD